MSEHDVAITGIGLVSSLGEGTDAHWQKLQAGGDAAQIDCERFAPYCVHSLPEIDWSLQIPKRGDQRQMETWQRLGTYTAGLALEDAGIKEDIDLCTSMDLVVAAGGGERDVEVDSSILAESERRNDRDVLINEKLSTELRPTLFLAQLSNLLAGNISIVHKVTGSSRTLMGEEGSGVSAIETAVARIRSGQSSHLLVGAAYQCEHPDMLLNYELGGYLHQAPWRPVADRADTSGGGIVPGSGAAFLVLESREHAAARNRPVYAGIGSVVSGRANRSNTDAFSNAISQMAHQAAGENNREMMVVSGASGAHQATRAEMDAFADLPSAKLRCFVNMTGHLKETQFPFAIALAALSINRKAAFPPFDAETESAFNGDLRSVLATSIGFYRNEGMALVTAF